MPISDTATAVNCLSVCDNALTLSEPQFLLLLIDYLATSAGIDLADITPSDLKTAVDDGYCLLLDRAYSFNQSPETMRAIALYLATQLE